MQRPRVGRDDGDLVARPDDRHDALEHLEVRPVDVGARVDDEDPHRGAPARAPAPTGTATAPAGGSTRRRSAGPRLVEVDGDELGQPLARDALEDRGEGDDAQDDERGRRVEQAALEEAAQREEDEEREEDAAPLAGRDEQGDTDRHDPEHRRARARPSRPGRAPRPSCCRGPARSTAARRPGSSSATARPRTTGARALPRGDGRLPRVEPVGEGHEARRRPRPA